MCRDDPSLLQSESDLLSSVSVNDRQGFIEVCAKSGTVKLWQGLVIMKTKDKIHIKKPIKSDVNLVPSNISN